MKFSWNWTVMGLGIQFHGPLGRIVIALGFLTVSVRIGPGLEKDSWDVQP